MTYGNYPIHKKIRKILVIKLRHLGDVLLTTPIFSSIKKSIPWASLDVLINKESYPILKNNPYVDNLVLFDRDIKRRKFFTKLKYEFSFYLSLWKQKYDLVINLTDGDRALFITKVSKAKILVGIQTDNQKSNKRYNYLVKKCHLDRHVVEKNLDAIRRIGIFPPFSDRNLNFFYTLSDTNKCFSGFLKNNYILIHPTSRWRFKCWPEKKVRLLIEKLRKKDMTIVLTSGPAGEERKYIDQILYEMDDPKIINLSGKTSVDELGYLIHNCRALICVDSFPFHIASCFKKPTVALFGPTSDITWGPWKNPNAKIVKFNISCRPCFLDGCGGSKMSDCLDRITVDQVMDAFVEVTNCLNQSPLKIL